MLWLPEDPLPRQPQGQLEPHPYWIGRGLIFAYSGTHRAHWVRRGRFIQTAGTQVASGGATSGKNAQISNANYQELGVAVPLTVFAVATLPTLPGVGEYPCVLAGSQYGGTDRGGIEIGVFASDAGADNRRWYSVCRSNTYKNNETIIMGPLATAQSPTSLMYTLSASGHAFTLDGAQYSSGSFAAPGVNGVDPMSIGETRGASDMLVECLYRFSGILSSAEYEALRRNPGILWEAPEEIVLMPAGGGSYSDSVAESLSSADSSSVIALYAALGSESVSMSDTPSVVWITSSSVTDTITVTPVESAASSTSATGSESISATDTGSATYSTAATGSESVSPAESQNWAAGTLASAAETVSPADTPSSAMTGVVSAAETVSSVDTSASTRSTTATGSETVSASDSSDWSASNLAVMAESVAMTDTQSVIAAFLAAVSEAIAATDSTSATYSTSASVAEAASLLDAQNFSGSSSADVSESISLSESAGGLRVVSGGIVEAVSLDDAWTAIATVYGQAGDTLSILDTATPTAVMGATVIELVSLTDSHYGFTIWTVARGGVFVRQALNSVVVRENRIDLMVRDENA